MKTDVKNTSVGTGVWSILKVTISSLLFAANLAHAGGGRGRGGVDGGGNGIFIKIADTAPLILFDLYVNDPNFRDPQPGDQIQYRAPFNGMFRSEALDYRTFQSFAYLRQRLALWKAYAPNLVGLIETGDFALSKTPKYGLNFIGTDLAVQVVDEVSVPEGLAQLEAYAGAYFNYDEMRLFVTDSIWNRAGLVSQAGFILHERMRFFQEYYELPNEDLQRAVYMIITQAPDSVAFDDSRFSKSWLVLHPNPNASFWTQWLGPGLANFTGDMLDCLAKPNPKACARARLGHQQGEGKNSAMYWNPLTWIEEGYYANELVQKNILKAEAPRPIQLVSTGMNNGPVSQIAEGPYSAMYGHYKIIKCDVNAKLKASDNLCTYESITLAPTEGQPATLTATVRKSLSRTKSSMREVELFGSIPSIDHESGQNITLTLKGDPRVTPTPPDYHFELIKE